MSQAVLENGSLKNLTLVRLFDAPRELVFQAWSDPAHFAGWWGPAGFTNQVRVFDARPGGELLVDMFDPEGMPHPMTGRFHEITPHERIVVTLFPMEDDGTRYAEMLNELRFEDLGGKTRMTLETTVMFIAPAYAFALDDMEPGMNESLDKLAAQLSGKAA